jgi:putative aldouronate transport system substrate-binding protein
VAADNPEFIDYSQKTYAQTISKIIVGELPVSAYDELLEGWYENGGEEYVQQMNEYIKSMEE